jgi:hypothetical protein
MVLGRTELTINVSRRSDLTRIPSDRVVWAEGRHLRKQVAPMSPSPRQHQHGGFHRHSSSSELAARFVFRFNGGANIPPGAAWNRSMTPLSVPQPFADARPWLRHLAIFHRTLDSQNAQRRIAPTNTKTAKTTAT